MGKSNGRSADTSSKKFSGFRTGKKGFKAPTEGLQYVLFTTQLVTTARFFVENIKKLNHHIAVSGSIKYEAPTAAKSVRTLTVPKFHAPVKPDPTEGGGYDELERDAYE